MSWSDAVRLAYTGVRRRAGRAVLTVAAVALAAALLTALLTIAGTARTRVIGQLAQGGPLAGIQVAAAEPDGGRGPGSGSGGGFGGSGGTSTGDRDEQGDDLRIIDDAAVERIAALPEVDTTHPVITARVFARSIDGGTGQPGPVTRLVRAFGTDLDRPRDLPVQLIAGRMPAPGSTTEVAVTESWLGFNDIERADADTILGTEVELGTGRATALVNGDIGYLSGPPETFEMAWQRVTITGVVVQDVADGSFLVPLEVAEKAYDLAISGVDRGLITRQSPSRYTGLLVTADSLEATGRVQERIEQVGFATASPAALIEAVQRYLRVVEIVLAAIGAIALAVAGLGITNALLAAVRERRREIGVLKAIGARDRDVRRVFLVEAGVLGLAGGVIGSFLGWLTAFGVGVVIDGYLRDQGLQGVGAEVPLPVFVGVILGSAALALVGGTLPAMRAAHLPAREAVGGS